MEAIKPKKTLVDETYEVLVDSICAGEILPGERLNQDDIALKLNVSRQPVNSAVAILRANGFVEDTGRRGVVVAAIEPAQFQSIYEFRSVIEPFAVTRACTQMSGANSHSEFKKEADTVLEGGMRAVESGDVKALLRADMDFHEMIYRWSANHVIENSMRMNWQHIRRSMAEVLKNPASAVPAWEEHKKVTGHLLAGDPDAAAEVMKQHIERAGKAAMNALTGADSA